SLGEGRGADERGPAGSLRGMSVGSHRQETGSSVQPGPASVQLRLKIDLSTRVLPATAGFAPSSSLKKSKNLEPVFPGMAPFCVCFALSHAVSPGWRGQTRVIPCHGQTPPHALTSLGMRMRL